MKLFVWESVLTDWTSGLVCALAKNEAEAWQKLYDADSTAWWNLQGHPSLNVEGKSQSTAAIEWLKTNKKFKFDTATSPKEITEPAAFVVWGGG